jgi:hypothetical protein
MERLAHRKGHGLEAVPKTPPANLAHFEMARVTVVMFSRNVLPRQSFAQKCRTATSVEKIAFGPTPFLHFPEFARNMASPWDRGRRDEPYGLTSVAGALV